MILLLFVVSVVVMEIVHRRQSVRPSPEDPAQRVSAARESAEASAEGLMALGRALDGHGKGARPAVAVPVANGRLHRRESSD